MRSDSVITKLPDLLIANPVVTVNQVKESLSISFPTANTVLNKLKEIGILQQTERQRNRVFIANEVIALLNSNQLGINSPKKQLSKTGYARKMYARKYITKMN